MSHPANWKKPTMRVIHAKLERLEDCSSPYRSRCPLCGGGLFVGRDQVTLALQREDCCSRCGQHVFYLDDEIGGEQLPPIAS